MESTARAQPWARPDLRAAVIAISSLHTGFGHPRANVEQPAGGPCQLSFCRRWETVFILWGVACALDRGHIAF